MTKELRVRVIFTADEDMRRAVAHRDGEHGRLATRDSMRDHFREYGYSVVDDMREEWQNCDEGCQV